MVFQPSSLVGGVTAWQRVLEIFEEPADGAVLGFFVVAYIPQVIITEK